MPESIPEAMAAIEEIMTKLLKSSEQIEGWSTQISKHLSYSEKRAMSSNLLSYEMVRMIESVVGGLRPMADMGWGLRQIEDWATKFVRTLVSAYRHESEPFERTMSKAYSVMRVVIEEAIHRTLMSYRSSEVMRAAYCSLVLTLRNLESLRKSSQAFEQVGLFVHLSEVPLAELNKKVGEDASSLEGLPSFNEVLKDDFGPMRYELFSLSSFSDEEKKVANCMSFAEASMLQTQAGGKIYYELENDETKGWRQGPIPNILSHFERVEVEDVGMPEQIDDSCREEA